MTEMTKDEEIFKLKDELSRYKGKLKWAARCLQHEYYCEVCQSQGCHRCGSCHTQVCLMDSLISAAIKR
jgi:hypothetical protein